MKIALLGYGKMGKAIEKVAQERGHEIVLKVDSKNAHLLEEGQFQGADVAIEFSRPEVVLNNIKACLTNQIPIAIGTTGWNKHYPEMVELCKKENTAMLVASNFSVGVNLFFALNKQLAKLMKNQTGYQVSMEEIHHLEKLDSPSGTAITLAEDIISENDRYQEWVNEVQSEKNQMPIISKREKDVTGTHQINYRSAIDEISISHIAHNRNGFALGAVLAAEYINQKQGIFSMQDVLNIQ